MPIDVTIPLSYKQTDPMASLSSMLDVSAKSLSLQKSRQTFDADVARAKAESSTAESGAANASISLSERKALQQALADPSQYRGQDGKIDYNKALPLIMKAAPTTGMEHVKNFMATQAQATSAQTAITNLDANKRTQLGQYAYSLKGQSLDDIYKSLDEVGKQAPELATSIPYFKTMLGHAGKSGQKGIDGALDIFGHQVMTPTEQQNMGTPDVRTVDDGEHKFGVNVKPGVQGMPQYQAVPGLGSTQQPGPTTPLIDPVTNAPIIKGASPNPAPGQLGSKYSAGEWQAANAAGAAAKADTDTTLRSMESEKAKAVASGNTSEAQSIDREMARVRGVQVPRSGPLVTGLAPGQAGNLQDNFDSMNKHYAGLSGAASDSQLALSLTGNIKALAKRAITGKTADKASYFNGLANALGVGNKVTGDLEKDSDMLKKEMAQFNMSRPASSDAAQTLINAGRPNITMKDSAIEDASDQFASQIKANLAVRRFMTPHKFADGGKGDSVAYNKARIAIEEQADPRIFQLEKMTQDEKKTYLGKLTQGDRQDLVKNSRALHDMGLIK